MRALALLLAALTLAGCLAPAASEDLATTPVLEDALAALEAGEISANLELLGEWRNSGSEIAAHGDLLYVMKSGTVQILNVSDPANIDEVAVIQGAHGVLDVKLSHDGKYLFVGDDEYASSPPLGGTGPLVGGIYVYDVSEPTAADLVTYLPIGPRRGPHMVNYHLYPDGKEVVFGANADVSLSVFDRDAGTLTEVSRYSPDLVFGFDRSPYVVDVLYQGWAHDMFVQTEPDGSVFMYVANWDAGLRIVDVTDPANPVEIGHWNDFEGDESGNLHTVAADWLDGRRIVVGSVEVGFAVVGGIGFAQGAEPGIVYVWDATDAANPAILARWENPEGIKAGGRPIDGGVKSSHNFQFEDGLIYLAHYALGLFVLDASTPDTQRAPEVLAYYREPDMRTWDVIVHQGAVWTSGGEGVLAHGFPLTPPGLTSRA